MFRFRSVNFPRNFRLFSLTFPFVRSIICTIKGASIDCTAIKSNSVRTPISKKEIGVFLLCCLYALFGCNRQLFLYQKFRGKTDGFIYHENNQRKVITMYIKKDTLIPPFIPIPQFLIELNCSVKEMAENQKEAARF